MRPLSNWKVNPQPSTGPSAGRVSPDPELHHPDLGTAQQHAERLRQENAPAIIIPHGTPSPAPSQTPIAYAIPADSPSPRSGADSPLAHAAPFGFLIPREQHAPQTPAQERHGSLPAPHPTYGTPFDQAVALQPLDRAQSNTGMEPHFAPLRPYSPSEAYLPGFNAEPHVESLHREMVNHNFATFMHHPQAPMAPAGRYVLEPSIADALLQFRSQVRAMPDPFHEFAQTYRMVDGNRMEAVRPGLITGFQNEVRLPEGSFPPGTGLVIHSHPPSRDGIQVPGRPSEADMLRAYQDRTNALQDPRSNVTSHILYDHGTDNAYIYDGRLGPDGNPRYYQAVLPPGHQAANQAVTPHQQAEAHTHPNPELPIAAAPSQERAYLPLDPSLMGTPTGSQNDVYSFLTSLAATPPANPAQHFPNPQEQAFHVPGTPTLGTPRPPSVNQGAEGFDMSQWIHSNPPTRPGSANIEGWEKGWNDFIDLKPKTPPA